jgi:hypothetical protein
MRFSFVELMKKAYIKGLMINFMSLIKNLTQVKEMKEEKYYVRL